jgi:hypothetical protein
MTDCFANVANRTNPGDRHFEIAPSDSQDMGIMPRAIYCAEDGTAQVVDAAGTVLPYAMAAGTWLPFRGVRINATGTSGRFYGWY